MIRDERSKSISANVKIEEDKAEIKVSSTRAPTSIGPQGDHVSAHALFVECVIARVEHSSAEDTLKNILMIIDSYAETDTAQNYFEFYKNELNETLLNNNDIEYIKNLIEQDLSLDPKTRTRLSRGVEIQHNRVKNFQIEKIIEHLIGTHLTIRNKLEYTSWPAEGNVTPLSNEGTRVKQAIKILKKINDDLAENKLEDIEKKGKKANEEIIRNIVDAMQDLFWYPRIPEEELLTKRSTGWKNVRSKYSKGTLPRNNEEDILLQVTTNHIELIFSCFNHFHLYQQNIIDKFLERTFLKGNQPFESEDYEQEKINWNFSQEKLEKFNKKVKEKLPIYYADHTKGASESESSKSASVSEHTSNTESHTSDSESMSDAEYHPGDEKKEKYLEIFDKLKALEIEEKKQNDVNEKKYNQRDGRG